MPSIIGRNRSPLPHRFIRRISGADACWSDRSKYGTTVGNSNIVLTQQKTLTQVGQALKSA